METKKLDFAATLRDALYIGVKNAPSIVAALVLFLITIWIPYLNIGTFIAVTLLPTQLAKGEVINPVGIFDSKYRRYMGEFFITMGLMIFPILIATLFLYVPGIVLSLAWSLAYYSSSRRARTPYRPSRPRTTPPTAANGSCSSSCWSWALCSVSCSASSAPSARLSTSDSSPSS